MDGSRKAPSLLLACLAFLFILPNVAGFVVPSSATVCRTDRHPSPLCGRERSSSHQIGSRSLLAPLGVASTPVQSTQSAGVQRNGESSLSKVGSTLTKVRMKEGNTSSKKKMDQIKPWLLRCVVIYLPGLLLTESVSFGVSTSTMTNPCTIWYGFPNNPTWIQNPYVLFVVRDDVVRRFDVHCLTSNASAADGDSQTGHRIQDTVGTMGPVDRLLLRPMVAQAHPILHNRNDREWM